MMLTKRNAGKFALSALLAAGFNFAVAQAPDAAEVCASCHNESGVTDDPNIPTIAGVGSFFLENQLAIFSEEARPCVAEAFAENDAAENHGALIGALSEDEKMALAEYFGGLPYESFEQEVDAALAGQGESIHKASCDRCHTASGAEPFDDAGILAGQPIPYLIEQMEYFKNAERWQPESMAEEIQELEAEQIKALAHFYAGAGQ